MTKTVNPGRELVAPVNEFFHTVGRLLQGAVTGSLKGGRSVPISQETEMPHIKKVSAATFSKRLSPDQRARMTADLANPTANSALQASAKVRIDKAFGYDPKSETEIDTLGLKKTR